MLRGRGFGSGRGEGGWGGVVDEVDEVPDFGGVEEWGFGDGHVPVSVVEEHG